MDQQRLRRSPWHTQLWVTKESSEGTVELKIDLVNDTAPRVGGVETDPVLGRTDNWRNILANIWVMARNRSFDWPGSRGLRRSTS